MTMRIDTFTSSTAQGSNRHRCLVVILLCITLVLWWALYQWFVERPFYIQQIRIAGIFNYSSPQHLRTLVRQHMRDGLLQVDVAAIQKSLVNAPWIAEASVRKRWPDMLHIWVKEQQPIARWGEHGFLNMRGEYFAPQHMPILAHLPLLSGSWGSEKIVLQDYLRFRQLLGGWDIAALQLDANQSCQLLIKDGPEVRLGKVNQYARLQTLHAWLVHQSHTLFGQVDYIDMRYPDGFAVRWRTPPAPAHELAAIDIGLRQNGKKDR